LSAQFRLIGSGDEELAADIFTELDATFFEPHPFTRDEAHRLARKSGRDAYALLVEDGRAIAYGVLRGWDEGYVVPSLGIAVRTSAQGHGAGRLMMEHLHAEAKRRGASVVRLRVHPDNVGARRLYESLGYAYAGEDRGELLMLLDLERGTGHGRNDRPGPATLNGSLLEVADPAWAATLRAAAHDFYHLPRYVALSADQERGEPRAVYVSDGTRSMLLPLVIRAVSGGRFDATSPYGYPGPIIVGTDDPSFLRLALVTGLHVLRDAGVVSAFIRLHPLLNPSPPTGVGTLVRHGETVSVDLTLPSEEIWAQMRANHRRGIASATRLGYSARMDTDWGHFESFKAMYRATMARRSADPFYFFDDAYFKTLRYCLGERLHLVVVEKNGALVAAGLFVETSGIVEYHLSGTVDVIREISPIKLMMHFVMGWARNRGNHVLHLGGGVGGATDSLFDFKAGFSPLRHSFATLRLVIDEAEYGRLVRASDPLRDPHDRTGYFPLFRQP
jgi:ribosomal protein S18 acetylase RimI-like enzyme